MEVHPDPDGPLAIPAPALALLAFQLVDRWGNRHTPRPSPRSEVLAAALLSRFPSAGDLPTLGSGSAVPAAEQAVTDAGDLAAAWRDIVERATAVGPYVGYLASCHLAALSEGIAGEPPAKFLAQQEEMREGLRSRLQDDPRYLQIFSTTADETNRAILRTCHTLALHLVRGPDRPTEIPFPGSTGGWGPLGLRPNGARSYRLHPWPFLGRRLSISAHGYRLAETRGSYGRAPEPLGDNPPVVRLRWDLTAPAEPA